MAVDWKAWIRQQDRSESMAEQLEGEMQARFAVMVGWDASASMARDPVVILIEQEGEDDGSEQER